LKTAEAEDYCKENNGGRPLRVGQLLDCAVVAKPKGRVVPISIAPEAFAKATVSAGLSLESLKPGMLVNSLFEKKTGNGIAVSFLGVFTGSVTHQHLEKGYQDKDEFQPKQKIRARILFIDLVNKQCALTTLPHLVAWRPFTFSKGIAVGAVLKDCKVVRHYGKRGLYVQAKGVLGFVKSRNLSDKTDLQVTSDKFAVGTLHTSRIIGFDYLHGALVLTLKKSIVDHPLFAFSNVKVGQIVQGSITRIEKYGLLVKLGPRVSGLCRANHCADTPLANLASKFKVGDAITCMVLSLDTERERVFLTHKKTLVNSELPKFSSFEAMKSGDITHGVITSIKEDLGIFVEFLNRVSGLVSLSDLGFALSSFPNLHVPGVSPNFLAVGMPF